MERRLNTHTRCFRVLQHLWPGVKPKEGLSTLGTAGGVSFRLQSRCCNSTASTNRLKQPASPRILITGATGLLGRTVYAQLTDLSDNVRGLCSQRGRAPLVKCDLTDKLAVRSMIYEFMPNIVIHLAAARFPDKIDQDPRRARALNVESTEWIAEAAAKAKAWLIFVSTDYVFDGTSPPYEVDAAPNPLNEYGHMKTLGERAVTSLHPHAAILRIPLLYGPYEFLEESPVTQLYADALKSKFRLKVDNKQSRYPLFTCDAAKVVRKMVEMHCEGKHLAGVFHWQGPEKLTKYQMLTCIAEVAGSNATKIEPDISVPKVPRPENSCLSCTRLEDRFGEDFCKTVKTSFRDGIREILRT